MTTSAKARLSTALVLCAIGVVAVPGTASAAKGFDFGVTAAEVRTNSAILWSRANKPGAVGLEIIGGKRAFGGCDLRGDTLRAKKSNDLTVQVRATQGLKPGTAYRYRFCMSGGRKSDIGRFATAPAPSQRQTIEFAVTGDQDALPEPGKTKPFWNDFGVWDTIRKESNDFNVMLGDTIYSDTEVPGYGLKSVALTVAQKWRKYKINLGQDEWTRTRGSTAYYAHWDDHEFVNDFSQGQKVFELGIGDVKIDGKTLYQRGVTAFRDYNPITYSKPNGIYRSFRWGKNLEVFFLDERSFRSPNADVGGACDNPQSGEPDLAPTAPQSTRNLFAIIVPSLSQPVPEACKDKISDPKRSLLGTRQFSRFKKAIANSSATFKVIMNEVPIQQYYALPYDRWEGFESERKKMLNFLRTKVKNVVFLTTDVHANFVNDARLQTLEEGGPVNSGVMEATTGPVATASYAIEIDRATGKEGNGALVQSAFLKPDPPNGVGMDCAGVDYFSYGQVTVGPRKLRIQLKDIDGNPVPDGGDRDTEAPACPAFEINAE